MNEIAHTEPRHPVHYVFVDCENVREVDLSVIGARSVHFTLLVGPHQTRLDVALVEKLLEHAASVQLVRLQSSGKNALDFALAFYLGKAANSDPGAWFHIVSRDTGFDPLIQHLVRRHIHVRRHDDFTTLPFAMPAKAPDDVPEDLVARIIVHLHRNSNNRPKRKKTLASGLKPLLGKSATPAAINHLIEKLCQDGHLAIGEKGEVTYYLDPQ